MFSKRAIKNSSLELKQRPAGFTLMELVIVIAIIALMSVAVYANYASFGDRGKVIATSVRMKEDLDTVRTASMDGQTNGLGQANGWGVYFDKTNNNYILFSDLNDSKTYDYPTKILIHGSETVSAGSFTDSSILSNTVTVLGATQVGSVGKPTDNTGYWSFDGAGDSLLVPHNAAFNVGANNFTIDLWFKTAVTGSKKALFYKGDGLSTQTFAIYKDASDLIKADIYDVNGDVVSLTSTTTKATIGANTWYHLALTRTGNILRLFINGAVHQSKTISTAVRAQSQPFYVGTEDDGAASPWNGSIDEVRLSVGYSAWSENFTSPTVSHKADDEFSKQVTLDPKLNFESLAIGGTSVDQLSVFYNPTDYYVYANGSIPTEPVRIKLNAVGAESGSVVDSQRSLEIAASGLATTYICKPDCSGKFCGDDGCGGQCGSCSGATPVCQNDACVSCEVAGTCTWQYVGQPGFSLNYAVGTRLFISNGDLYVKSRDDTSGDISVTKYNGPAWASVGSINIDAEDEIGGSHSSFYVDGDTPYLAYRQASDLKVAVVKYSGSSWVNVGSPSFSDGTVSHLSLFVSSGTPYLVYTDSTYPDSEESGYYKAVVKQYNGSSWVTVGSAGFTAHGIVFPFLFVDSGTPYLAYGDVVAPDIDYDDYRATVMKYNGAAWVNVGSADFSAGKIGRLSLFVDSGTPYVAYVDYVNNSKITVMKYNGAAWVNVGSAGFGSYGARSVSLFLDSSTPYIAYGHNDSSGHSVMKYNGSSWVNVGSAVNYGSLSPYSASLFFYDNTPYTAAGGNMGAAVWKYGP